MSKPQIQVSRAGECAWEISEVKQLSVGENTWSYEKLGRISLDRRVVRDDVMVGDDRFHVDVPQWQDVGFAWHRLETVENHRGWLTYSGALRWLLDRHKKAS